jgi:hypothetical protein
VIQEYSQRSIRILFIARVNAGEKGAQAIAAALAVGGFVAILAHP